MVDSQTVVVVNCCNALQVFISAHHTISWRIRNRIDHCNAGISAHRFEPIENKYTIVRSHPIGVQKADRNYLFDFHFLLSAIVPDHEISVPGSTDRDYPDLWTR